MISCRDSLHSHDPCIGLTQDYVLSPEFDAVPSKQPQIRDLKVVKPLELSCIELEKARRNEFMMDVNLVIFVNFGDVFVFIHESTMQSHQNSRFKYHIGLLQKIVSSDYDVVEF